MKYYLLLLNFVFTFTTYAQSVSGHLSLLPNEKIVLEGFQGLNSYKISSVQTNDDGYFQLSYSKDDYGVGYLKSVDSKPMFVILGDEGLLVQGEALSLIETLYIVQGKENQLFAQYASEQPRREQALSAWVYLEKIYAMDSLFAVQEIPQKAIHHEKARLRSEEKAFLDAIPEDSYVRWFLPTRKLVSTVSTVAQYRAEEIPETIEAFRRMDYTDPRLYKSGLFKDAIESHFWLIENSGRSLDSVFIEMQISIDAMMDHLIKDEKILNEVTDYLFDLLERHSLFKASEYLALKVLNEVSCTVDGDLAKQLETYRAMKKGNTAPDINFTDKSLLMDNTKGNTPKHLSDLKSSYTVIVFGASWCPKCAEEIPQIAELYKKWKAQGVEVVFVSLDESKDDFKMFVQSFPFISVCDFKKWEGNIVQDYYVFGTPAMFLLDDQRKILLRPHSVKQMDAWVDWFLK